MKEIKSERVLDINMLPALVVKSLPGNVRDMRHRLDSWVGKIPWRRAW